MRPIIVHVDLDAFFAAVEERDRPWLRGFPIVVGADPEGGRGRGVVATANYPARAYGIRSAMPVREAWRRSEEARGRGLPAVAFIRPDFRKYEAASRKVMRILRKRGRVEEVGLDEAYLDLSPLGSFSRAEQAARAAKREIARSVGVTASVGIGENRMVAKIAANAEKPDGLTVVSPGRTEQFLAPLPVRVIPGVGPKTEKVLAGAGIQTVADARKRSWEELEELLGSHGFSFYERVRGIASAELAAPEPPKSVGEHETLREDTRDFRRASAVLDRMSRDILGRLRRAGFSGFRTVVLTVRFGDFETRQRSTTSPRPLFTERELSLRGLKLLLPFFERRGNPRGKAVRMIGLRVEKLSYPHLEAPRRRC